MVTVHRLATPHTRGIVIILDSAKSDYKYDLYSVI